MLGGTSLRYSEGRDCCGWSPRPSEYLRDVPPNHRSSVWKRRREVAIHRSKPARRVSDVVPRPSPAAVGIGEAEKILPILRAERFDVEPDRGDTENHDPVALLGYFNPLIMLAHGRSP